jgi:hypothetical protein
MWNLINSLKDAAIRPVQTAVSRMATDAVEWAAIGILAIVTLAFAVATLYVWFEQMWGPLVATGAMAGLFLLLTLIMLGVRASTAAARRKEDERRAAARDRLGMAAVMTDQVSRLAGVVGARERMVLGAARQMARRSNPWVLVAAAVLSGFVGGRMLDRD